MKPWFLEKEVIMGSLYFVFLTSLNGFIAHPTVFFNTALCQEL